MEDHWILIVPNTTSTVLVFCFWLIVEAVRNIKDMKLLTPTVHDIAFSYRAGSFGGARH
jgi:hypothetical protein